MRTIKSRFAVLAVFFVIQQATPVFGIPPECKKPAESPVDLIDWQWSAGSPGGYRVAFQGEYVFVSDPWNQRLVRYPINGGQPTNWLIDAVTQQSYPQDVHVSPATGDLYVAGFANLERRVLVFNPAGSGTPTDILFTGPTGPDPGDIVATVYPIAIHPITGDLYVVDEGEYDNGEEIVWISRIQRFTPDGTYDNFWIDNALVYNPIEDYGEPPVEPECGAWHYPRRMWVDAAGNIYLGDHVDDIGTMRFVHKFDSTGVCVENWDAGQEGIEIDADGFVYTYSDSIRKLSPDQADTLYTIAALSNDIEELDIKAGGSEFFALATEDQGQTMEIKGPRPEGVNFLATDWQDPGNSFWPRSDSLQVLLSCDLTHSEMRGVVADGVSPLLLRWYVPGPGEVTWVLEDPDHPTEESLLGTLSSLDRQQEDSLTITADVEFVGGEYVAFVNYAAPVDFDRLSIPSDGDSATRPLRIVGRYYPNASSTPELIADISLEIHRPPVMFVHGLWSNGDTWLRFPKVYDDVNDRWRVYTVDYNSSHGSAIANNAAKVRGWIDDIVIESADSLIVTGQIDAIVHSMGGLILRKFADSPEYKRPDNMGKGDFHKILFLDTPHHGSPLADLGVAMRNVLKTPFYYDFIPFYISRRAAALGFVVAATKAFNTSGEQIMGLALDDLTTYSSELASLNTLTVPVHAHLGDASSFWSIFTPEATRRQIIQASSAAAWLSILECDSRLFASSPLIHSPSDLIVLTDSQQGGLSAGNYLSVQDARWGIHTEVPKSPDAGNLAEEWALRRTTDGFFADSIPAPVIPLGSAPMTASASLENTYDRLPDFAGTILYITYPADGDTIRPGSDISVTVENSGFVPIDTATVVYPGGGLHVKRAGLSIYKIPVPEEYIGEFPLMVIAELDEGTIAMSPTITLNVVPEEVIQEIRVEPAVISLTGQGDSRQIRVIATYADGIERNVTPTALGTDYSRYSPGVIHVTAEGELVAIAAGTTILEVGNSQFQVDVPVSVADGAPFNNPPHASTGGPYAACDSQLVVLDGSATYDLDEINGEILTYEWDLDADGEFDDAVGVTPLVEIRFAGQFSLIGLRVTDGGGLVSTDYAILEAGPGCLDGEFMCAVERPGMHVGHVAIDGAGNVYLGEWNLFGISRIVKFSANCDSVLAIDVPKRPYDFDVANDGTVYLADAEDETIYKYANDGTPLSPVSIAPYRSNNIEVDDVGNLYTVYDGVMRKFDASGNPLKTWNVEEAIEGQFLASTIGVAPDQSVYLHLSDDRIVHAVLQSGDYVLDRIWGRTGVDPGTFNRINDLEFGSDGELYVCDYYNHRIQQFRSDSTYVRMWKGSGAPEKGAFYRPVSVSMGTSGLIAVAEENYYGENRVQVMGSYQPPIEAEITPYTRLVNDPTLHTHPDTAVVGCPHGDRDQLVVSVAIDPSVVVGPIPKSALTLSVPDGTAVLYSTVEADSNATLESGKYRTTLTASKLGGCMLDTVLVSLNGIAIGHTIVDLRSPDINTTTQGSYGFVELADLADFSILYASPPKPYNSCADYHPPADTIVDLLDFTIFGSHWNHSASGGGAAPAQILPSAGVVRLELVEEAPLIGPRRLVARVRLENVEAFKVMLIAFQIENPDITYEGWNQESEYSGQTMCAKILRDGESQVFLGVVGPASFDKAVVELGEITFNVSSDEPSKSPQNDISLVFAELLEAKGTKRALGGAQFGPSELEASYQYVLAQNYPNPFNPSTTIAYSIASASDVTLAIFDVRGKLVRTLVNGRKSPNNYRVTWDGTDNRHTSVASGVYFYRLIAGDFVETKKMVLLR